MRYFIHLAYNGTRYNGWQTQRNAPSVQETINTALSMVLQTDYTIVGAGRTDTGVHASNYYAHFDSILEINTKDLCYKLNRILSSDIVIYRIFEVHHELHARFSALSRTYEYTITQVKNPFLQETAWYYPFALDVKKMNDAALLLSQYQDFTSFSKLHTDVNNNNCTIIHAKWKQDKDILVFSITANRFLRNMVRSITGTLIDIGRGKTTIEEFIEIINSKNRQNAGQSIPAHGLSLVDINYDINKV